MRRLAGIMLAGCAASASTVLGQTPPAGATAICRDGSYSFSVQRQGRCSHHGGVAPSVAPTPLKVETGPDTLARRLLTSAETFRCRFSVSTLTMLDSVPLKTERRDLTAEMRGGEDIVFDRIDRPHHRAREIGSSGTGHVDVISASDVLSFIEITPTGNPIVYTIYGRLVPGSVEGPVAAELLAVSSGHIMGFTSAVATQDYGRCRAIPG